MHAALLSMLLLAQPAAPQAPSAVVIQVKLTELAPEETIFSTSGAASPGQPLRVAITRGETSADFSAEVEMLDKEEWLVRIQWSESPEKGRRVVWAPAVRVKRGASAQARVEWKGGGRVLTLSLN